MPIPYDRLRAVVFDFDGTLAETNIDFGKMRQRIYDLVKSWGLWEDGIGDNRYVLEVIEIAAAKLDHDADRTRRFTDEAQRVLTEVEMETCALATPYEGVPEALRRLREGGLQVGIVTRNCRACVDELLQRHPFDHTVRLTRDDVTLVKPDPTHLLAALEALGVTPEEAVMVGDHRSDIECANAAGVHAVGVLLTGTTAEEFAALGAGAVYPHVPAFVDDLCAVRCG